MEEPIFKGATRPAMLWGVPLVPMVCTLGAAFLLALWGGVFASGWIAAAVAAALAPGVMWMRTVTRRDDQRFRQMALLLRLSIAQRNARLWRARSYAPLALRGASDAWQR